MSSSHKKELTTPASSKTAGAGNIVTGDTVLIPPDCEELLLAVTTDDSVSGTVDAVLEVSVDGVNWTTARTKTLGAGGVPAQVTHGTVTMPANDQAAGTTVCSVSFAGGALADSPTYTIELTEDAASGQPDAYYLLRNTTTAAAAALSISASFGDAVELQTYGSVFNFTEGYLHDNVNIKVTESTNGLTDEIQVGAAETGIFRHASAIMSAGSLTEPIAGNAATGTTVCALTIGGGPVTGNVITYSVVMQAHANSAADTDAQYFRIKSVPLSGPTIYSTYSGVTKQSIITVAEGATNTLEVNGLNDAVGDPGSANWYFDSASREMDMTITNTESINSQTASVNVLDIDVEQVVTWVNEKYWQATDDDNTRWGGNGDPLFANMGTNENGAPDVNEAFTFSAWYRVEDGEVTLSTKYISPFYINSSASNPILGFNMNWYGVADDNLRIKPAYYVKTDTLNATWYADDYYYPPMGEWFNLTLVKAITGTSAFAEDDIKIWYNGTNVTGTAPGYTWDNKVFADTNHNYNGINNGFQLYGPGDLKTDEIAVWDRALTDAEVAVVYNGGDWQNINSASVGGQNLANGMIQYWRFGDGDSAKNGTGTADSYNKVHDMSPNAAGVDLDLNDYGGTANDGIKSH